VIRRRLPRLVLALLPALAALAAACSSPAAPSAAPTATSASDPAGASTPATAAPTHRPHPSPFKTLAGYLAGRSGVITAAVYDARGRHLWVYHPGVLEYTASIVKVEIMGTAMWQAQRAGQPVPPSQLALMTPMIEISDNTSATDLLADVGGPAAVLRFDHAAGLTDTTPHSSAPIPGTPWPGWGLTTTTARDEVTLVRRFAFGNPVLAGPNRDHGLYLMEHVAGDEDWGVTGGVPAGTTVALKNGWIQFPQALPYSAAGGWQIDSIGWVHGNGRDYVLAVLTRDNPSELYGEDTIGAISRQIYAELGSPAS